MRNENCLITEMGVADMFEPFLTFPIFLLQALFYIVPVILSSFIINFPKWFELELKDMVFNEGENELREFDHSNNTLDQGNLLRGVDSKTVRR